MLKIEDKKIDNNRPIRIPIFGKHIGISEHPCLSPVLRYAKNAVIEVQKGNQRALDVASIFKYICPIVEIDKPEYQWDSNIDCYPKKSSFTHMVCNFFDIFGIEGDNLAPFIKLTEEELNIAFDLIKGYKKPCIVFSPICGGFENNDKLALAKMLPENLWIELLEELSKKYTILYTGKGLNYKPLNFTVPIFNLKIRELAALICVCGKLLGSESGLMHLGLSTGAFCHVIIPTKGYLAIDANNGTFFQNYEYKDSMFKYQTKKIRYYLFNEYKDVLNYL